MTYIGKAVFSNCEGLMSINVDVNNPNYDSRDNCNAIIETNTNTLISGCQKTSIPNSVTIIGDLAFWGFTRITSIVIPKNVIIIGQNSFLRCISIESIICYSENAPKLNRSSFSNVPIKAIKLLSPLKLWRRIKLLKVGRNLERLFLCHKFNNMAEIGSDIIKLK